MARRAALAAMCWGGFLGAWIVGGYPSLRAESGAAGTETLAGFVKIPAGRFTMGSPETELCRYADEQPHSVVITRPYWMKRTEVTQAEWLALFERNPALRIGDRRPVETVTWYDAVIYCNRLSVKDDLRPCYYRERRFETVFDGVPRVREGDVYWDRSAPGYRLPTEAEWEWACRAGTTGAYYGGIENTACDTDPSLDPLAWYRANCDGQPHATAQKRPNAWGLHDMLGNLWEWCWDHYQPYPDDERVDPIGPATGRGRVERGGSWRHEAKEARPAKRGLHDAGYAGDALGFRIVRNAAPRPGGS